MEILKAIILGIVQGIGEFLPISSSGHIELAKYFVEIDDRYNNITTTVVLHIATAFSTIIVFRKEIFQIFLGLFSRNKESIDYSIKIIISMLPAGLIGVFFEDFLDSFFNGKIMLVGFMLLITGLILFVANRKKNTEKDINFLDSFIIGISQAIALLPGISRSGATISTSVLLGIDKEKSARFSFLMVLPLIIGKILKDLFFGENMDTISENFSFLLISGITAFIVGLVSCIAMINIVKKSKLIYFAFYCIIIGLIAIFIVN